MARDTAQGTAGLRQVVTQSAPNPITDFRNFLTKGKDQIAAALPKHMNPDRMIRLCCTEFAKNPLLQKCTPVSIFGSLIQASQLGLEVGVLGQAYMVPYKNNKTGNYEAQLIPGYKGLIGLARRSGEVTSIETHIVYANDEFDLTLGLDTQLTHKPRLDGERGTQKLVYGVAKFRDGGHHFEWMPISEVDRIRARSKSRDNGPWVTDYDQMARKTLIRRMANYLPMSIELQAAIELDNAADEGKHVTIDSDFIVVQQDDVDLETGEINAHASRPRPTAAAAATQEPATETLGQRVRRQLEAASDVDVLDVAADLIGEIADNAEADALTTLYKARREQLAGA